MKIQGRKIREKKENGCKGKSVKEEMGIISSPKYIPRSPIYEFTPEISPEKEVVDLYTPESMQIYQMIEGIRKEIEIKKVDKEYEEWVKLEEKIKRKRRKIKKLDDNERWFRPFEEKDNVV